MLILPGRRDHDRERAERAHSSAPRTFWDCHRIAELHLPFVTDQEGTPKHVAVGRCSRHQFGIDGGKDRISSLNFEYCRNPHRKPFLDSTRCRAKTVEGPVAQDGGMDRPAQCSADTAKILLGKIAHHPKSRHGLTHHQNANEGYADDPAAQQKDFSKDCFHSLFKLRVIIQANQTKAKTTVINIPSRKCLMLAVVCFLSG